MKVPFFVSIFLVLLLSCTEQTPRENPQTIQTTAGQAMPGVIWDVDSTEFKATDAIIYPCDGDDIATWSRAGDAKNKMIKIEFDPFYECILNSVYEFNGTTDVAILIKKNELCACPDSVRNQILQNGYIPLKKMSIYVNNQWEDVDGFNSPPRILIGGGSMIQDQCCL